MKRFQLPLLIAVALAGCTPSSPPAAPVPEAGPRAATAPGAPAETAAAAAEAPAAAPAPPSADAPALATAPAHWWLADADAASPGAGVEAAYRALAGRAPKRTVVVGVIDSGVDTAHVDLHANLWANPGEVAGNGVDDDGNGYVDDVRGWNFIGGADGRDVDDDTYEVTRLYATCQAQPSGAGAVVAGSVPCARIDSAFTAQRSDTEQQLMQVQQMAAAVDRAVGTLRSQLGRDSLTVDAVRSVVPMRSDVRQAQMIYLQLASAGITPAMIADEQARLETALERSLNPDFDPRPIVGDDYADLTQREYGNADVVGPDPGHGTGVAGIIAAVRGNGIGQDGVAPSARIMVVRTVPDGDERDKDVANAIRYAVDNGADIINMSFGKGYSPGKSAVDAAVKYAESKGVLLVHAAGNDGQDLAVAGNYPNRDYANGGEASNWIEVGASDWQGGEALAAPFSNYGQKQVDVFAPGVAITTTAPGNDYQTGDGTSFAAPVVTGVAALIMAYYPELTAAQVRQVILDSARPYREAIVAVPGSPGQRLPFGQLSVSGGVVDARAALERAAAVAAGGG